MTEPTLQLGEAADEADWRALVEQGLKGARWERLVGQTGDGIAIQPLYREPDVDTARDESGFPGAAPFIRGARSGPWRIRQSFSHPDPQQTNDEILADLEGGVAAIELVLDPSGHNGVAIKDARDLDIALSGVILDIAPISLDAGAHALDFADTLGNKLRGAVGRGVFFNVDPIGAFMRSGALPNDALTEATTFARWIAKEQPEVGALRVDARPVHEAGGTEAQEIAAALSTGIAYLRAPTEDDALGVSEANAALSFAVAIGQDVLVETAKLRALRLCWARVLEASGVAPEHRAAHIHAFTSRRMMTRYDAWTNILRVTTAAFAAAIGGADDITTYPFTDALGLPTPFARRVARNTQHVLLEECRLGHVADPAGGAWYVEKLTRDLAAKAWEIMQDIERRGGIIAALQDGYLPTLVAEARTRRQQLIATRRETITGITDFPLLGAAIPEISSPVSRGRQVASATGGGDAAQAPASTAAHRPLSHAAHDSSPAHGGAKQLHPIRWAAPFEALRDRAEAQSPRPAVFFANLGALAEFGPRAQWARNLFASGGVGAIGEEEAHATMETLIDAFRLTKLRVAVITGADACYAQHAENCAQRLKAAGADWLVLAGKPGESETKLRAAGVDQFVFAGQDALKELATLHAALGLRS